MIRAYLSAVWFCVTHARRNLSINRWRDYRGRTCIVAVRDQDTREVAAAFVVPDRTISV